MSKKDHIAQAKACLEKGDGYYRDAADHIIAARKADPRLTYAGIGLRLGRSETWVYMLVRKRTNLSQAKEPFTNPFGGREENERKREGEAAAVLRDSERRQRAMTEMPADEIEAVIADAHEVVMARLQANRYEHATDRKPTTSELMGDDTFDASESWIDGHLIRVCEKTRILRRQMEKWGLVIGSMTEDQAFEHLQQAERDVAEVRAALQERMADRYQAEV